jgi:hypothetical protein
MEHVIEDRELDCGDVGALLSGLIDDELPVEVRHAAERHMAQCAKCRAAMDGAERNEELMLASFEVTPALPAGFEDAVFARTTRSLPLRFTQPKSRWFAVSGWLAAAAMLTLSAVIWTLNQGSGDNLQLVNRDGDDGVTLISAAQSSHYALPPEAVSSTSDTRLVNRPARDQASAGGAAGSGIALGIESAQGEAVVNTHRPMFFSGQSRLSEEDQQTLIQVSNLIRMMLEDTGDNGFAVTERMRQMIETAELVTRLERVRENVPVEHRFTLMNAESILWRISTGPLHESDLRVLRQMAESLDLAGELDRLSGNMIPNRSL